MNRTLLAAFALAAIVCDVAPCDAQLFCRNGVCTVPRRAPAPAAKQPIQKQQAAPVGALDGDNFGLDQSKIGRRGEVYAINGHDVSQAEALASVEGSKGASLPDDAHLPRLTVIGPEDSRRRVLADLRQGELADAARSLVIQDYDPQEWAVARAGFHTAGTPTICIQTPAGQVLHRQEAYTGPGPLLAAIRKANPLYDPKLDPNLLLGRRGAIDWSQVVTWILAVLVGGGGMFALQRKASQPPHSHNETGPSGPGAPKP